MKKQNVIQIGVASHGKSFSMLPIEARVAYLLMKAKSQKRHCRILYLTYDESAKRRVQEKISDFTSTTGFFEAKSEQFLQI